MTEQAIEVTERIADSLNRQVVTIDESQFGFVRARQWHNRCNFYHPPAAGEIAHGKQTDLYVFCGPREGVQPSSSESDLVGSEKAWC